MSIDLLVLGKVYGQPEERTSRTGSQFVTAKLRATMDQGEAVFVSVLAFSETARMSLMALSDGDSLAVSGSAKLDAYIGRDGGPKASVSVVAAAVLTPYGLKKKRDALAPTTGDSERPAPILARADAGEDFESDTEWLDGGAP